MAGTSEQASVEKKMDVRIVSLNADKTRKMIGSDTVYQVYFELSDSPPGAWRTIFEQEWKGLNVGLPLSLLETSIERAFLVMHCPLEEIAKHVPVLKQAVAATNAAFAQYLGEEATRQKSREDIWKDERKLVEHVAQSLHFESSAETRGDDDALTKIR